MKPAAQNIKKVLIWGGTGQAKVVAAILQYQGYQISAVFDKNPEIRSFHQNSLWFQQEQELNAWLKKQDKTLLNAVVAIGGTHGFERSAIAEHLANYGLQLPTLVHHRAWVADSVKIDSGCQILAMTAISEEVIIGKHCIINTQASIDHECVLGQGVHIMPSATLAGSVQVGDYATIGTNATILPHITIGARAVVGAGAVVIKDVPADTTVKGNPAR